MMDLILVDATSYIFRAYHALPPLKTQSGFPTGALVGFAHMLQKLKLDYRNVPLVLFFDAPGPTYRHSLFEQYKAHRKTPDPDLILQIDVILELCTLLGYPFVRQRGTEADDLIAAVARHYSALNYKILIVSPDKDFLQLIQTPDIFIYHPLKKEILAKDYISQKYGIEAHQIVDYFSLVGDSADGILGVPSIGPKTAQKLLNTYESLDQIYVNLDKLSVKMKETFERFRDQAFLSRELFSFQSVQELVWPEILEKERLPSDGELNYAKLEVFCEKYELKTFWLNIKKEAPRLQVKDCRILSTIEEFFSLDRSSVLSIFIYGAEKIEIGMLHHTQWTVWIGAASELSVVIDQLFCRVCYLSCAKSFLKIFSHLPRHFEDYRLLSHYQVSHFGIDLFSSESVPSYALSQAVNEILERGLTSLQKETLKTLEYPLIEILDQMERHGILIHREYLQELDRSWIVEQENLRTRIISQAGVDFNLNSPKQLGEILFNQMHLSPLKKTSSGQYSTNEDVLYELKEQHPIVQEILEYRRYQKLRSTYSQAWLSRLGCEGRLHTTYDQTGTVTGRLSSANPNIQNIPIRSDEGAQLRKAVIAPDGFCLVSLDYSQIELRLMAHFSQDVRLLEAYENGEDIHAQTAEFLFGVSKDQVSSHLRAKAKTVNFGLIYGMSAFGLSKQLKLSVGECQHLIDKYFEIYPGVFQYMENMKAQGQLRGYVETLFGRRIYLNRDDKQSWRAAVNGPLQGTASEIVKKAMIAIAPLIETDQVFLVMQVHDELVFEMSLDVVHRLCPEIQARMEGAVALHVPLEVQVSIGPCWE